MLLKCCTQHARKFGKLSSGHRTGKGQTRLSDFTFTFYFHALEKEMATHSSILAWRIPGVGAPGGLPSLGSHRVRHDWSDLASLIFLKRSLGFPILLFSSISLPWSLRKVFLSLPAILHNSAFKWVYLSFSPLPFTSLLSPAICKACSDNHFAFLHFFCLVMASCTMSRTCLHSSSVTLSDLIPWIYLSLPLYNHKGFDWGHTWMV